MPTIDIAGRRVGPGSPCLIIAEAGVNHDGRVEIARRMIDEAAAAGVDAVKFQTFRADRLAAPGAPKAEYQRLTTGDAESQVEMLRRLELPREAHRDLMEHCAKRGVLFLSSPFSEEDADFLEALGAAVFKIPSGEATNLPFLAHVARKGRPLIVSTGMCTLAEVEAAVGVIGREGNRRAILLHCVSSYPAPPDQANLRAMQTLARTFGFPVGFSDHTPGIAVALAAAALEACVIEKHLTLDRSRAGPDQAVSLEPAEMAALVRGVRTVESALGHGRKEPAPCEADIAGVARKSLVAARDLPAGAALTEEMIAVRRPGTGLSPSRRSQIVGRVLRVPVRTGTVLTLEMLS